MTYNLVLNDIPEDPGALRSAAEAARLTTRGGHLKFRRSCAERGWPSPGQAARHARPARLRTDVSSPVLSPHQNRWTWLIVPFRRIEAHSEG